MTLQVLFDGSFTQPRLDHPECVTVGPDGLLWCGGEAGQVFRIDPARATIEQVADTGGFCLGLTFGPDGGLYICDQAHAAVLRLDPATGSLETFADGADGHRLRIPNFAIFDPQGRLYVSDSHGFRQPGPGVFRFEPDGTGTLWYDRPLDFANGLALDPTGTSLYVAETFGHRISCIAIRPDGSAGTAETFAVLGAALPDGLLHTHGRLYVACYEPSQVLCIGPDRAARVVHHDPEAHLLCHPTNLVVHDDRLVATNLGRWHLTALPLDARDR